MHRRVRCGRCSCSIWSANSRREPWHGAGRVDRRSLQRGDRLAASQLHRPACHGDRRQRIHSRANFAMAGRRYGDHRGHQSFAHADFDSLARYAHSAEMDGVPGLSFAGIAPGNPFVYRFRVVQNGTYWYHSHSGFQEQLGLWGAIVIEPQGKDPIEYDRDYVVLLSDWTDTKPETLYSNLKKQSDYYNFHRRTAATFIEDGKNKGLRSTVADRLMWGRMNMTPTDIADVTNAAYIYTLNGNPADANWAALFTPGERVRLRFINASAMTLFDVRIPGLPMTVVQANGNYVQPVTGDEMRLGVPDSSDSIVPPPEQNAH